jgi:hypothetical protein
MELFKKYEFNSKEQAEQKIANLLHTTNDDVTYLDGGHTIVHLGHLWIEEPTYDEQFKIVTQGVSSDKYSVDVLWQDLDSSPYGWASYEITVEGNGAHTFLGRNF